MLTMHNAHVEALDIRSLRLLATLLDTASITRTGEAFQLSQPAASRAVERLRRALGDPILVRGSRGFVLTARARSLRAHVAQAQQSLEALFTADGFAPAASTQTFRVAASEYAFVSVLPPVVKAVRRDAPGVSLNIMPVDERTLARVESGDLDCAFWGEAPPGSPFMSRKLFLEHFIGRICSEHPLAAKARRKPITLEDYLAYPHIMVTLGNPSKSPVDIALDKLRHRRRVAITAPTFSASAAAMIGTDLIMTLPSRLAKTIEPDGFTDFALPFKIPNYSYWLVWHKRTATDPALGWFTSIVLAKA